MLKSWVTNVTEEEEEKEEISANSIQCDWANNSVKSSALKFRLLFHHVVEKDYVRKFRKWDTGLTGYISVSAISFHSDFRKFYRKGL